MDNPGWLKTNPNPVNVLSSDSTTGWLCVSEREGAREREREKERKRDTCRERERDRERESEREKLHNIQRVSR